MIIAHGTWLSTTNRFFVWGETEPHEETSASNGAHPHQLALEDVEQKLLMALADEDTSVESECPETFGRMVRPRLASPRPAMGPILVDPLDFGLMSLSMLR